MFIFAPSFFEIADKIVSYTTGDNYVSVYQFNRRIFTKEKLYYDRRNPAHKAGFLFYHIKISM